MRSDVLGPAAGPPAGGDVPPDCTYWAQHSMDNMEGTTRLKAMLADMGSRLQGLSTHLAESAPTPLPSAVQEELRVLRERVAFLERQWAEHVCSGSTSSGVGPRAGCAATPGSSSGGGASRAAPAEGGTSSGGGSRATAIEGGASTDGGSNATAIEGGASSGGGSRAAAAGAASAFTCTAAPACSFSTRSAQAFLQHFGTAHRSELLSTKGGGSPAALLPALLRLQQRLPSLSRARPTAPTPTHFLCASTADIATCATRTLAHFSAV